MKEIKVTKYEANDGKIFNTLEDCLAWEKYILIDEEELKNYINTFLSNSENYEEWVRKSLINKHDFIQCYNIVSFDNSEIVFNLTLGYIDEEDEFMELDEDFCIDTDKWWEFRDYIKEKFGCEIKEQNYYWPN